MKRALIVIGIVLAGCEKKSEPASTPTPPPAPAPGAVAPKPPPEARPAADVVVEVDRVQVGTTMIPDQEGAIDRAALEAALAGLTGDLTLAVAPTALYQRVVDVMDVATKLGLEVAIDTGGTTSRSPGPMPPLGDPDHPTLVLTITTDAIMLGGSVVTTLADLPAGDDIPTLRDALAALSQKPSVIALQADRRTPGDIVIRAIATARAAGIDHVAFVVDTPGTPPPLRPRGP